MIAMTAAGLDALSDGRFTLGLGASGPQVVERWHGVAYDHPLGRTRETVEICRMVWRREVLVHDGRDHPLPYPGRTGLGEPLKLINTPVRDRIPIYLASLGPRNVALAAKIAEGWLPAAICPMEAAPALRDLARPRTALYVGGMGAKGQNFYNTLFARYGFEREAGLIQDLYLAGRRAEAEAVIPDDFLEAVRLIGDEGYVRERFDAFRAAGVTTLDLTLVGADQRKTLQFLRSL